MKRLVLCVLLSAAGCKTSIDFDQGRPYSCEPDAGEDATATCGTGWRCGLEGRCHALGDEKPWLCRASSDCEGAWRCGLEGRCHALGDAQAWQCNQSSDCEAGWVCGLEGTCHDPSVLAAYLCSGDQHCVAPWRCGYAGRCLDATAEVSTISDTSVSELTVLGPRFFTGQPEALVGADLDGYLGIAIGSQIRFLRPQGAGAYVVTDFDAGTPGSALAVDGDGAYLVDKGGVRSFRVGGMNSSYVADGGGWFAGAKQGFGPFVVHDELLTAVGSSSFQETRTAQATLAVALANCAYFANGDGLWVQPPYERFAEPSPLTLTGYLQRSCRPVLPGAGVQRPLLRTGGHTRVVLAFAGYEGVERLTFDGGAAVGERNFLGVADVTRLSEQARSGDPLGTDLCRLPPPGRNVCPEARVTELLPHCDSPCDVGDSLTDLRPGDQAVEVECTGPLGQTTWSMRYDGDCAVQALTGRSSRYHEVRTPGDTSLTASYLVQRGPHGQVWVGDGVVKARPLVLDEPAGAVLRPLKLDGGVGEPRAVGSTHSSRFDAQLGLLAMPAPETLAFVSGSDELALLPSGNISVLGEAAIGGLAVTKRVAALELAPDALTPPFTATLTHRADAGVLLVSVADGLYGADEASWGRKLPLRLVPQPGFGVLSLAVSPGPSLSGYLNTRSTVFAFSSASELEWQTTQLSVPPGQLVEVWAQGGRARVGFADGRVFTLPSAVPVASALPSGEVVDYLGACGQIYGLSRAGLFRVNDAGQWEAVPLPGAEVVLGDTLGGGRLLEREGVISVFNGSGGALTFRPTPCP